LAAAGHAVTLVNSALDVVGLPGYGPDLPLASRTFNLDSVFTRLPRLMREAWLRDALVPDLDDPSAVTFLLVDRRAVSLRLKWLLESFSCVSLRQGLVTSIEMVVASSAAGRQAGHASARAPMEVHTGFGEVLHASACVLACGLALGGRISIGEQTLAGGRYGEVAADDLRDSLVGQGVSLRREVRGVGSRFSSLAASPSPNPPTGAVGHEDSLARLSALLDTLSEVALQPYLPGPGHSREPLFPGMADVPAPYESPALLARRALVGLSSPGAAEGLFPDGRAGRGWYASPGLQASLVAAGLQVSQPEHLITGEVVAEDTDGLVSSVLPGVWVIGQAAGARNYLDSLASGAQAAGALSRALT
jgi:hypothetical protein